MNRSEKNPAMVSNETKFLQKCQFPRMKYGKYWFDLQFFFIANVHVIYEFLASFWRSFENFQEMLDGSKFLKRCLLGISIRAFDIGILSRIRYFDIGNFQFRDSDINSDISNIQFDEEIYQF
jgi:hypothetical protein